MRTLVAIAMLALLGALGCKSDDGKKADSPDEAAKPAPDKPDKGDKGDKGDKAPPSETAVKPADKDPAPATPKKSPATEAFTSALVKVRGVKKGEALGKALCDAHTDLNAKAEAIDKSAPPDGVDKDKWLEAVEGVQGQVGEIGALCDDEDFEAAGEGFRELNKNLAQISLLLRPKK